MNVFDLAVIDWCGTLLIDPMNPPLAGTEGAKGYRDFMFHFIGFLKGSCEGSRTRAGRCWRNVVYRINEQWRRSLPTRDHMISSARYIRYCCCNQEREIGMADNHFITALENTANER